MSGSKPMPRAKLNTRPRTFKPKSDYIETDSGNRISRKSQVQGSQYIILGGKNLIEKDVVIRGDLHREDTNSPIIAIGRYCIFSASSSIVPPCKDSGSASLYYPIKIGSYVHVGEGTSIEAASIGSCVYIGNHCNIGKFTIIKDCVKIEDHSVIPPFSVISSFSLLGPRISGPAQIKEELPETAQQILELFARKSYFGIDQEVPFEH